MVYTLRNCSEPSAGLRLDDRGALFAGARSKRPAPTPPSACKPSASGRAKRRKAA